DRHRLLGEGQNLHPGRARDRDAQALAFRWRKSPRPEDGRRRVIEDLVRLTEQTLGRHQWLADQMNLFPEVAWDRCTGDDNAGTAYGWIARDDGNKDFLLLMWIPDTIGFCTSSARYSR